MERTAEAHRRVETEQRPGENIASSIEQNFGFRPEVIILNDHEFNETRKNNPYKSADGKSLHFYFCKSRHGSVDSEKQLTKKNPLTKFPLWFSIPGYVSVNHK